VGEEHGVEVRWIDLGGRFEKWTAGMVMQRLVGGDGAATWKVNRRGRMVGEGAGLRMAALGFTESGYNQRCKERSPFFKRFSRPGYFQIGGNPLCTAENAEILILHH